MAQLAEDEPARPLSEDAVADVVVVGAGIAGVSTAFFILRSTALSVVLVERDRVARGATAHNAGQLTTYFERPLIDIAQDSGIELAAAGQRDIEAAHGLLDLMAEEAGATVRIERFSGHMGMFNLHHLKVHLGANLVRRHGGLSPVTCMVSEEAEFLGDIPPEFDGLYAVVPQHRVRELLEIDDDRYRAVLSNLAGCANSGLLAQQVLAYLQRRHSGRFKFHDKTAADDVVVSADQASVIAGRHRVDAGHVVLCTNGFVQYRVRDGDGQAIQTAPDQRITGRVAHMTAFVEDRRRPPAAFSYIRNTTIGGETPYVYVTRRSYDRPGDTVTLTCMGGPEYPFYGSYERTVPFPGELLSAMDAQVRPFAQPSRPQGRAYDFHWHGLMGYNDCGIRVVGPHRRRPRLLYNLGCNGVGFLPSIYGGHRVARFLNGETVEPSIFDPR